MTDLAQNLINSTVGKAWRKLTSEDEAALNDTLRTACEAQGRETKWHYFFLSSVLSMVTLWLILTIWEKVGIIVRRSRKIVAGAPDESLARELPEPLFGKAKVALTEWKVPFYHRLQKEANKIVCCQNLIGEIIAVFAFLVAMVAVAIYIHEVTDPVPSLEICRAWMDSPAWQVDFACNLFFLAYFILRLMASNRKYRFVWEMYSIVDFFTIPPAFVALYLDRNWTGFRFLRILHIFSIPEVLQYIGHITTRNGVRLSQLVCQLAGVVLVGAGVFHLVENSKYPLKPSGHSYWRYLYFTIITISTVGYGDISPLTPLGRVFCCLFILAALGLFASSIPDIASMLSVRYRYGGNFVLEPGSHHLIVCGEITCGIASNILASCFHNDQEVKNFVVVFVSNEDPDLEMQSLLKKNFTQVAYIQGDVLNSSDMERAALKQAFACLIIANKKPAQTDAEDALNIMRVISIKNIQPSTRVIVQLFHRHHQTYLFNLPTWRPFRGDTVINLSVLKMGLLATSCEAMGFSTLMVNLLRCYPVGQHRFAKETDIDDEDNILDLYKAGFVAKIRVQRLSDFYTGMTFHATAAHCYTNLNVLLIGLFERPIFHEDLSMKFGEFVINPAGNTPINHGHLGVFVSHDAGIVDRAWFFCGQCHSELKNGSDIKFCGCEARAVETAITAEVDPVMKFWLTSQHDVRLMSSAKEDQLTTTLTNSTGPRPSIPFMDNSARGTVPASPTSQMVTRPRKYHQVPTRTFDEACVPDTRVDYLGLAKHIVVVILAEPDSPPLGLYDFVAPLRSINRPYGYLKDIVLFGNADFLMKEWSQIAEFPRIHIVKGNAVECKDLDLASITTCSMCVVMSSPSKPSQNDVMDDQRAILATLRIKAAENDFALTHLNTKKSVRTHSHLNLLTTLEHDENIRFLEQHDPAGAPVTSLSRSYMSGEVLVHTVLDALTVSTYYNPLAIPLIQSFMHGRSHFCQDYEPLDTGNGSDDLGNQSMLSLMDLGKGTFAQFAVGGHYKDVVMQALNNGLMLLGVYRLLGDTSDPEDLDIHSQKSIRRYVIAAPPSDFILQADDLLFVFLSRNNNGGDSKHRHTRAEDDFLRSRTPSFKVFNRLMDDMKQDLIDHQVGLLVRNSENKRLSPYHRNS